VSIWPVIQLAALARLANLFVVVVGVGLPSL
jgi:hypothetical protein